MILRLKSGVDEKEAIQLAEKVKAFHINYNGSHHLITSSSMKKEPEILSGKVEKSWV